MGSLLCEGLGLRLLVSYTDLQPSSNILYSSFPIYAPNMGARHT